MWLRLLDGRRYGGYKYVATKLNVQPCRIKGRGNRRSAKVAVREILRLPTTKTNYKHCVSIRCRVLNMYLVLYSLCYIDPTPQTPSLSSLRNWATERVRFPGRSLAKCWRRNTC